MNNTLQQQQALLDKRGKLKTSRIPIKVVPTRGPLPRKPKWIRAKAPTDPRVQKLKTSLREQSCIRSVRKRPARIWANVLAMAPQLS